MGDGVLRDFEPTPDDAMCDCAYARRARAAGERICDLGASLRFAQRGFFDLLPDFLMTQVPVFAMSWEAVWCTEYHGTGTKNSTGMYRRYRVNGLFCCRFCIRCPLLTPS